MAILLFTQLSTSKIVNQSVHQKELFFTRRWAVSLWGTRIFWGGQRGVPVFFFQWAKGGAEFFYGQRGGGPNFFYAQKIVIALYFAHAKGGPECFREAKEGDQNFSPWAKGGTKNFYVCKGWGDQKKWKSAVTDRRPPLPVKNDSSLISPSFGTRVVYFRRVHHSLHYSIRIQQCRYQPTHEQYFMRR